MKKDRLIFHVQNCPLTNATTTKERQEIALFERIFNLDIRSFVIIACHLYS